MSKEVLVEMLRQADIVAVGRVILRAGENVNYYIDIKKAYGEPDLLKHIAQDVANSLNPQSTVVAASGYGGIPLGVMVSQIASLPLSLVRDTNKSHGRKAQLDGYIPTEQDLVSIVDDVFTTGNSLRNTAQSIQQQQAQILGCHVVVARNDPMEFEYPVTYLVQGDDLT